MVIQLVGTRASYTDFVGEEMGALNKMVSGLIEYFEDCVEDYKYIKVLWKDAEKLIKLGGQTNIKDGRYVKIKLLSIDVEDEERRKNGSP